MGGSTKEPKHYMAIDQYGNTFHTLVHPRKDLMERLGVTSAEKMYIDDVDGNSYHAGYVVAGHWCYLYEVTPIRKAVSTQRER